MNVFRKKTLMALCMAFSMNTSAHVLVDDFTQLQETLVLKQDKKYTEIELTNGSELYALTRKLVAYSPLYDNNSAHTIISTGQLYINNTINAEQLSTGFISIEYTFNNTNFKSFTGILVKTNGLAVERGKIMTIIDGPSGESRSKWHRFNGSGNYSYKAPGNIYFPFEKLNEFRGTNLRGNITTLKILIRNVKLWEGDFSVELTDAHTISTFGN